MSNLTVENRIDKYLKNSCRNKYSNDEEGYWIIYGEDPNCDFGGSHHEPFLEVVSGKYLDVITYAVNLRDFYTWGGGGRIVKTTIIKVDKNTTSDQAQRRKRKHELEQQLAQIKKELGEC